VTVAVQRWPVALVPHSLATIVDDQQRVTKMLSRCIAEDQPADATALSGSAMYVFRAEFWQYVAAAVPSDHGKIELATALQRAIDDGHVVRAVEIDASRDLTRPVDLLRHNFPYLGDWLP